MPSGRTKGTQTKITKDLQAMIIGALQDNGGRAYLARQAKINPVAFMSLLSKIVPRPPVDVGSSSKARAVSAMLSRALDSLDGELPEEGDTEESQQDAE